MKRFVWSIILSFLIVYAMSWAVSSSKGTEKQRIYSNTGVVVALGQCKNGECSFQYTDKNNSLQYATSSTPVSIGQLVYQQCWYEEVKGNLCYTEYQPSKN
ncbi:hypothetical protein [Yersinia phage fHe-Yen9-04]|uniref:Uncharacterized protein n=2 Tax=Eneladusvirus Yen904 TaxID=2560849 RepID=A0A2C9CWK2_9CAUD|nr:membrane protein [Yersinia phage fHe-Yen9-04]SOK58384.1 hypothetical protein [Yersinia phage fHe-Yen9-04]SOK58919.1 hypothetical protein [Yersinia phage fHe-Yen9-03]VUE36153.1 hypothetical protein [Yersinia phage fHe-Yen9-04]